MATVKMPEQGFVQAQPQAFVDVPEQQFVDMPEQGYVAMPKQGFVDMPETYLAKSGGGGAEFRRGEAAGLAELERGYAAEDAQRQRNMYNLLRGTADTGYDVIPTEAPKDAVYHEVRSSGMFGPPSPEKPVDPMAEKLAYAKRLYGMMGGDVGAPTIKMNEMMKQGYGEQRGALGEVIPVMEAQQPGKEAARQGMMETGQTYVDKLKQLQGQQSDLFAGRKAQMAEDEARLAATERSFDANRVLRDLSSKPVSSGALAFTAGLVGALKGQAGDMSPNTILGEVDKAIERDVMNQREEYSRMQQGMQARRTHFLDARQMGADEQQALATSTVAAMDQYRRALEFADARITDANQKAAVKGAIGALKVQQGKVQFDIDRTNAANALSASKANRDRFQQVLGSVMAMGQQDPKMVEQASTMYHSTVNNPNFQNTREEIAAVGDVARMLKGVNDPELRDTFGSIKKTIKDAIDTARAKHINDGESLGIFVSGELARMMHQTENPKARELIASMAAISNQHMKAISGSAVNSNEAMRNALEVTTDTPESFRYYVGRMIRRAKDSVKQQMVAGKYNPAFGDMMRMNYEVPLSSIDEYLGQEAGTEELKSKAVK